MALILIDYIICLYVSVRGESLGGLGIGSRDFIDRTRLEKSSFKGGKDYST